MEDQWFRLRFEKEKVELFLYDVTSSYLEGQCNELADYVFGKIRTYCQVVSLVYSGDLPAQQGREESPLGL